MWPISTYRDDEKKTSIFSRHQIPVRARIVSRDNNIFKCSQTFELPKVGEKKAILDFFSRYLAPFDRRDVDKWELHAHFSWYIIRQMRNLIVNVL